MQQEKKGRIFNIQRFSVHDGPGIRDIVFFKGCPLRCVWCSNPESQHTQPELSFQPSRCIGTEHCGYCIKACPHGVLGEAEGFPVSVRPERCIQCGACAETCPAQARKMLGRDITLEEAMEALRNQAGAWRASGGVTLSGGEPIAQAGFAEALLRRLKETGTNTALETCGYGKWEDLKRVATLCDVVFYDVKLASGEKHRRYTEADNALILENLKRLRQTFPNLQLIVRTPVIPGINDSDEELEAIAGVLREIGGIDDYELLPYHGFGESKYRQLGRIYALAEVKAPDKEKLMERNRWLRQLAQVKAAEARETR